MRQAEDAAFKKEGKKTQPSRKWLLKLNTESELHYEFLLHVLA